MCDGAADHPHATVVPVDLAPDVIVPAHCTGWKASLALAGRLPDAFIANSVGTRFDLVA
jgi:7,8-dihydropterin-6-yl-methyl-4-(beta-D-ribofuranosyl)aminobenzene 5'-phosphate synthase